MFCFLRAQISAYRSLARNQPLTPQIAAIAAGKRTGDTPPECPTPPAPGVYGDGQGSAPAGGKPPAGAGQGDAARGGGGAPPTPLPMTGQMAPPTQLTPPLVNPVSLHYTYNKNNFSLRRNNTKFTKRIDTVLFIIFKA